ncbi:hypothetical protein NUW58_g2970 [Xylaria curta]|uniref:Uncharacterized protein n=1 Tax=Xylaria curta TaxID=42375 RepID=A0ACC1PEN6_9PEZI|nr:hypothetical protein NUW58_g2970 [Xylaria curta]
MPHGMSQPAVLRVYASTHIRGLGLFLQLFTTVLRRSLRSGTYLSAHCRPAAHDFGAFHISQLLKEVKRFQSATFLSRVTMLESVSGIRPFSANDPDVVGSWNVEVQMLSYRSIEQGNRPAAISETYLYKYRDAMGRRPDRSICPLHIKLSGFFNGKLAGSSCHYGTQFQAMVLFWAI